MSLGYKWTDGGFGMAALNYDGDVLTDELAQIHCSPGFLSSVLNGVNDDGSIIKEFEASHGTVTDMWNAHLAGKETSLNPLSMTEALVGAMVHSAKLNKGHDELITFATKLQAAVHAQMVSGKATRDLDKDLFSGIVCMYGHPRAVALRSWRRVPFEVELRFVKAFGSKAFLHNGGAPTRQRYG